VILEDGFISEFKMLKDCIDDKTGMVIPNILTHDGSRVYSQGIYISFLMRFYDYGKGRPRTLLSKKPARIIGPCSAAAFYRRTMLETAKQKTGYFDERFFFLVEDVDLAWRCNHAGWNAVSCSKAFCRHMGNSCHAGEKVRQYLSYRNRKLMIEKNMIKIKRLGFYVLSGCYECIRFVYLYIFNPYVRMKSKPEDIIGTDS